MKRPSWMLAPIEEYDSLPLEQIALQLSRLNRYAGAVEWSVLQHSLLVWDLVKNQSATCQAWALLHDAAECWIGDALLPAKQLVGLAWSDLETVYDRHIWRLAGIQPDDHERAMVQGADKQACMIEMSASQFPSSLRPAGFRSLSFADEKVSLFALSQPALTYSWRAMIDGLTGLIRMSQSVSEANSRHKVKQ